MIPPKPENLICPKCKDEEGRLSLGSRIKKDGSKSFYWNVNWGKKCQDKNNSKNTKEAQDYWKRKSPFSQDAIKKFGETKKCTPKYCNKEYPRTEEHWYTASCLKDGLNIVCRHCSPDRKLFQNYGIRQTDKNGIHAWEKGICPLFEIPITTNGDANVDHDHSVYDHKRDGASTPEIRRSAVNGLTCSGANTIMGILYKYKIDPLRFAENLIKYEKEKPAQAYFQSLQVEQTP